jgi:hypothetical protein
MANLADSSDAFLEVLNCDSEISGFSDEGDSYEPNKSPGEGKDNDSDDPE